MNALTEASGGASEATTSNVLGASSGGATYGTVFGNAGGDTSFRGLVRCSNERWVAVTTPACGDGKLDAPEQCDDANPFSGDGCDSRCRLEADWRCPVVGEACTRCGNCLLDDGEECDDGDLNNGDGCSSQCRVERGYVCGSPMDACLPWAECGDGHVSPLREVCDDGNSAPDDGCAADCRTVEPGFVCRVAGQPCIDVAHAFPWCGDGVVQPSLAEQCDNGVDNGLSSDCTADCQKPRCGDGQIQPGEFCDDGVLEGAYGECLVDCTFWRPLSVHCSARGGSCGDGVVQSIESCDNGVNNGHDGICTTECTMERNGHCGDKTVNQPYEQCDDGNQFNCDGCTANCQVESSL